MKSEAELLRIALADFEEKAKQAGIDLTAIKKPIDEGTSTGKFLTPINTL